MLQLKVVFITFENYNCKNKNLDCNSITVEERKRIFENFWSFIAGSVKQKPVRVQVVNSTMMTWIMKDNCSSQTMFLMSV